MVGKVGDIAQRSYGSDRPEMFPVAKTPEEWGSQPITLTDGVIRPRTLEVARVRRVDVVQTKRSREEVPTTIPKAPAQQFEEDKDIGSPPPPPPTEPHPDDIPKGEDVPLLKKMKAPPEVRPTYFGPE